MSRVRARDTTRLRNCCSAVLYGLPALVAGASIWATIPGMPDLALVGLKLAIVVDARSGMGIPSTLRRDGRIERCSATGFDLRVVTRVMRLLLALVGTSLAAAAVPAGADAYRLGGKKWPGRTITYHANAPGWGDAIRDAVNDWNSSGMRIRFKPASRVRAKLQIVEQRINGGALLGSAGEATLGWASPGAVTRRSLKGVKIGGDVPCGFRIRTRLGRGRIKCERGPRVWLDRLPANASDDPKPRLVRRLIVAHELGHVLGLKHAHRRCSVMSYERETRCSRPPYPWQARCRILEDDDVRGVIRRYGGRMRPLAPEFCDVDSRPAPLAPSGLQGKFDSSTRLINVYWWETPGGPQVADFGFAAAPGACPTEPAERLGPTTSHSYSVGSQSGSFCLVVWSYDEWGQSSPPATTWVDVPAIPDEA